MLIECPHCYRSVLPRPDGECPSCRKNTRDTAAADPTRTLLTVSMGKYLPPCCLDCGEATERYVVVKARRDDNSGAPRTVTAVILSVLAFFAGWFIFWGRTRQKLRVDVSLPQCELCAKTNGRPKPESVNFQRQTMAFIVHRRLAEH